MYYKCCLISYQIFRFLVRKGKRGMSFWVFFHRHSRFIGQQGKGESHKENIKKTRETITSTVDTKKLYVSKYSIRRSQRLH